MTTARPPAKPTTKGPVELALMLVLGLVSATLSSWVIGVVIEIGGDMLIWKGQGIRHAQAMVEQDLAYIAAAPRSLLVPDTVAFARQVVRWVRWPYERLGVLPWYVRLRKSPEAGTPALFDTSTPMMRNLAQTWQDLQRLISEYLVISMFVAQDVVLRLCTAAFAIPAFVLATLLGVIDGLVRRDRRRWMGGRESSFVYHHAKRYAVWVLTGGFALYLSWPFGGFNPAHMVLVFTVLSAFTLSTTVAAFKKYA